LYSIYVFVYLNELLAYVMCIDRNHLWVDILFKTSWYGMVWYGMVWYGMVFKHSWLLQQRPKHQWMCDFLGTVIEVLPKEKKQKEEKTAVLGQCSFDLAPLLTGKIWCLINLSGWCGWL